MKSLPFSERHQEQKMIRYVTSATPALELALARSQITQHHNPHLKQLPSAAPESKPQ